MELNICCMYPELLGTYGDLGNAKILEYRARARGINVNMISCSQGESFEVDKYDIVIFGGGQASALDAVFADITSGKKQAVADYIENGGVMLSVCSSFQLMGEYFYTEKGEKKEGLGLLPVYTEHSEKRFTGNVISVTESEKCVGFENHRGKTYTGDLKPFGEVEKGYGNNGEDKKEGAVYNNTFCTFLHGPLLSKNPVFADKLITLALEKKYGEARLLPIDDEFELSAKKTMIKRMK